MTLFGLRGFGALLCAAILAIGTSLSAQPPQSTLSVSLLQSGQEPIALTLGALDAMEQEQFTTTTIWSEGDSTFSGVPLKALLASLGVVSGTVEAIALNDYSVSIPVDELEDDVPIVATRTNGATMSVREKGPFWIVYPYDRDARFRSETAYSRSIWQLNRLSITQ